MMQARVRSIRSSGFTSTVGTLPRGWFFKSCHCDSIIVSIHGLTSDIAEGDGSSSPKTAYLSHWIPIPSPRPALTHWSFSLQARETLSFRLPPWIRTLHNP